MANLSDDVFVMIRYERLCELLKASEELITIRRDNARLEEQLVALRMIQSECLDKIRELERFL